MTQVHQEINEQSLTDDYEFMTEQDMIDEGFSEILKGNHVATAFIQQRTIETISSKSFDAMFGNMIVS